MKVKFNKISKEIILNYVVKNTSFGKKKCKLIVSYCFIDHGLKCSHPTLRRHGGIVMTFLCTFQRRRRYIPNKTPNDVSKERHKDVSVVRLHYVLLERHNDVSKGRNNDVPSVRLHDVSKKSQMRHPTTSQRYVTKTCQWYVSTTSH